MIKKMNDAERLFALIQLLLPDAKVDLTAPSGRGRVWWLEAEYANHVVSIEWSDGRFGIRTPGDDDYGIAPSEEVGDVFSASTRVYSLLVTGEPARPRAHMFLGNRPTRGLEPGVSAIGSFLRELRTRRERSQRDLASRLESSQAHVSQTENREDMLVSTLREYVAALGGELDIVARFPNEAVELHLQVPNKVAG